MTTDPKLLPCPFCGGSNIATSEYWQICKACSSMAHVETWNRRPSPWIACAERIDAVCAAVRAKYRGADAVVWRARVGSSKRRDWFGPCYVYGDEDVLREIVTIALSPLPPPPAPEGER